MRIKLFLAGLCAMVVAGSSGRPTQPNVELAQFGPITKKRASPIPQRTPAGTDERIQPRENTQRQGGPFGGIHK